MLVYITAIGGVVIGLAGILLLRPVASLLGAEGELLENCVSYGRIILFVLPAFMLQIEFQSFFSLAEKPSMGLWMTVAAGVTNMALDALFVHPKLLDLGLCGMVGKGKRAQTVLDAVVRNGAVYFAAVGGAGALLSKSIKKSEVVAYDDLGTEAIRKLEVENFPVIVVIDKDGNNLYETAIKQYCKE